MNQADVELQRIAGRQSSTFSRAQALAVGVSDRAIAGRLERGEWRKLFPGVYIASAVPIGWRQQLAGALLACGPTAVASHRAAATVWRFMEDVFVCEVTISESSRRSPKGIAVHRARSPEPATHDGFRVTRPMRTLLDLASCLADERIAAAVDNAHRRGLIHPDRLRGYLDEPMRRNAPGSGVLREIAATCPDEPNDSELESLFFNSLRRCRLQLPVPQHPVFTASGLKRIDYAYPDAMIAIELDSWGFHGSREAFESDRPRRNELELLGWHVLNFTWRKLTTDPVGVAVEVGRALGAVAVAMAPAAFGWRACGLTLRDMTRTLGGP